MALSYEGVCDDYDHGVNDLMKMQIGRIVRPVYLGRTKPSQQATSQKDATRQDRMEPGPVWCDIRWKGAQSARPLKLLAVGWVGVLLHTWK